MMKKKLNKLDESGTEHAKFLVKEYLLMQTQWLKDDLALKAKLFSMTSGIQDNDITAAGIDYSHRQIAISYRILNITIDKNNAEGILIKYSSNRSPLKLINVFSKLRISDLDKLNQNKTTDSKHLKDLEAAKRLISGIKFSPSQTKAQAL